MESPQQEAPAQPRGPRQQLAAAREARAVHLRLLGLNYRQIAASLLPCADHRPDGQPDCPDCHQLYADHTGCRRAVLRALQRDYDLGDHSRDQLRQQHIASLKLLHQRALRAALGGDWEAARVALRALDAQAKVLGLYAPTRIQVTDELDARIDELLNQFTEEANAPAAD